MMHLQKHDGESATFYPAWLCGDGYSVSSVGYESESEALAVAEADARCERGETPIAMPGSGSVVLDKSRKAVLASTGKPRA